MSLAAFFAILLKASLLSTGGMGNVPILHQDLVSHGWATDAQFAEALAIGQISPGPNGLWVISFAYLVAGPIGAALALAAVCLPPTLVLALRVLYRRVRDVPAVDGFMRGISVAVVGIFAVVLLRLLQGQGFTPLTVGTCLAALAVAATNRVPVAAIVAFGAIVGAVAVR